MQTSFSKSSLKVTNNVNNANANGGNGGTGGNNGCSYKTFLACNPRDYDWKGGLRFKQGVVKPKLLWGMTWVHFMEVLCGRVIPSNKMEKLERLLCTVLFDSGADFSFISTKFMPLLNVRPSIVSPGYVIEVANGKKEEFDRIIHDCKLELGNSLFTIDLIPWVWKIAKPLTSLTQKNKKYEWGVEQEEAFQTLKDNLCNAPILLLPDEIEDFVVYCDA
ncbi:putative reverse transcriptase domain-containing protein [Tanacetum coccineum]